MAPIYDSIFKAQKQQALALAAIKGWKITKKLPNGGISELVRVDENGNPIYYSTENAGAAITTRANRLNSGGSLGLNLDGQNMNIGIWDGGKVRATHVLLAGRVTQVDNASVLSSHATHVSGTMMGNGTTNLLAKGMASQANLRAYDWDSDTSEVTAAAANGLLISNHSYGNDPDNVPISRWGKYDADAKAFDKIMFNAPFYLFVNSAGNSRNGGYNDGKEGYDLLSGKSTSKNGMIVAAVNQVTNYVSASSVIMSNFSSWGPTDDGRIKPDICGKGVNLRSSVSSSDTAYDIYSGTSMSSPNVAGTLLLLQQHYNNVKGSYMRSATLRGLALHTADEAGSDPGPDYRFGWGLLNAEKAANLITNEGVQSTIKEKTLIEGESYSFNVNPYSSSQQMQASICWTDPAGNSVTNSIIDYDIPVLVNDLDIRVVQNNVTNYPWKLNPKIVDDPATKGDNIVDNIERIDVDNPSGTYTVTISHKGSGLTNDLQKYSLIMSNVSNTPILLSSTTSLLNRICQGTTLSNFNFQFETKGSWAETANLTISGLPTGATATFTTAAMSAPGNNALMIANLEGVPAGSYPIVVTATAPSAVTNLFFTLVVQNMLNAAPALYLPATNANQQDNNLTLTWENIGNNVANYTIEIAKDAAFTTSFQTFTTALSELDITNLDYGNTYYWRVKANNVCGTSVYSDIFNFSTLCSNNTVITLSNITINSATATWTNPNVSSTFEVLVVPHGSAPTGTFVTVATNSYTFDTLNSNTDYDVYVRSSCTGNTFSQLVTKEFSTLINHCVDGIFYDSGGVNGNYSNGEYYSTTMNPINPGDHVTVTFTAFELEDQIDRLTIYNGPNNTYPYIGEQYGYTGTNSPGTVTSTDVSGKLTFVFYSDGINTAPGFNATVSCANLATVHHTKSDFVYYPNPANSVVNFIAEKSITSITIYNLLGQLIKTQLVNDARAIIPIQDLPEGTYLFKIQTDTALSTVRISKRK
jgi:Subtilase family/Secretion system C-terminal sorting domain/CUB domain